MSPESQKIAQTVLVSVMLVSMMFSMGLSLTPASIGSALRRPGDVVFALIANFIVLPAAAFGLVTAFSLAPAAATGVIVCASAPGAAVATLLSRNAGGDVARSVAFLMLLVFCSVVFTPVVAAFWLEQLNVEEPPFTAVDAISSILTLQVAPLCVGMALHVRWPEVAARWEPRVAGFATALLVLVVVAMTAARGSLILEFGFALIAAVTLFVVGSMLLGYAWPGRREERVSMMFVNGSRNIALSTMLAERYLDDEGIMSVMIFGFITYVLLLPLTPVMARHVKRSREA